MVNKHYGTPFIGGICNSETATFKIIILSRAFTENLH